METDKFDELVTYINNNLLSKNCLVIGIDGYTGIGKSSLADKINEKLRGKIIRLDDFLEKKRGKYIDHIKIKEIKEEIERESNILIV